MVFGYRCSCCGERQESEEPLLSSMVCGECEESPPAALPDLSVHTIPADTPVVCLDAAAAFAALTPTEKAYAHALGKADWEGAKICACRTDRPRGPHPP